MVSGQVSIPLQRRLEGTVGRQFGSLPVGAQVELMGFRKSPLGDFEAMFAYNNKAEFVMLSQLNMIDLEVKDLEELWIVKSIEAGVYSSLLKNGFQYDRRSEIEQDVNDYLSYLNENDLFFQDAYLENYISSLVRRILPVQISDGRPGNLDVRLVKDTSPNAGVYSSGLLIINTGLLSTIDSEEELMAVLSHEIAHYVLDHSIKNINAAIRRQNRAEFWAAMATGVAAITESYQAAKHGYYPTGEFTYLTSLVAYSVASGMTERLGMKYSREQELEADRVASEVLSMLGVDQSSLSSVLLKLNNHNTMTNNRLAMVGDGSYPTLRDRISVAGEPGIFKNHDYHHKVSMVNTFNARQLLLSKNYAGAEEFARKNIDAGVATEDDYMVLVSLTMEQHFDEDSNLKALGYLNTAKSLNIYPPMEMFKKEALIYLRMGKNEEALKSLTTYRDLLETDKSGSRITEKEYEWTVKMMARI